VQNMGLICSMSEHGPFYELYDEERPFSVMNEIKDPPTISSTAGPTRRDVLERLVWTVLRGILAPRHGQREVTRLMSQYVPDDALDEWAPIELRDCSDPPNHAALGWTAFCDLHSSTTLAQLDVDAGGRVYFLYYDRVPRIVLELVTAFFAGTRGAGDRLPRQYVGLHVRDCNALRPWEKRWATRLWDSGPDTMLTLYAFMGKHGHRTGHVDQHSLKARRIRDITELALAMSVDNTRTGLCRAVDGAFRQQGDRCNGWSLRGFYAIGWLIIGASAFLLTVTGCYYYVENVRALNAVVNSLFGLACVAILSGLFWCMLPLRHCVTRQVTGATAFTCFAILTIVLLLTALLVNTPDTSPFLIAIKVNACVFTLSVYLVALLTMRAHNRPLRGGGGIETVYSRRRI
jgi:hypothetical protein